MKKIHLLLGAALVATTLFPMEEYYGEKPVNMQKNHEENNEEANFLPEDTSKWTEADWRWFREILEAQIP